MPVYSSLPALRVDRPGRGTRRFGDRLPFSSFPTLGEGDTPVARLHRLARSLASDAVDIKLEGSNPTGSHKDRMTSQFVARALDRQAPVVAAASSGNAGASLAAYAAAAGLRCAIVTTPKISPAWRRAIEMTGAELHFVEDPLDRWRFIRGKGETEGWFSATNVSIPPTSSEPFGVDGYKTLAYELALDPQTANADTILIPTARGDLLWGIYAGFKELVDEKLLEPDATAGRRRAISAAGAGIGRSGLSWPLHGCVAAGLDQRNDHHLSGRRGGATIRRNRGFRQT